MRTWQKARSYRKHRKDDGSFAYFIVAEGEAVEVSWDVYAAYARSERQLEYMALDLKRGRVMQNAQGRAFYGAEDRAVILPEREVSLDRLVEEGWDYPEKEPPPEEAVLRRLELEDLRVCLERLDPDDAALIRALFFGNATEREYAASTGKLQQTIHARKRAILARLRKFLGK